MFCWVEQPHFIHVIICLFLFDTDHPFGKAFHSIMLYDHLTRDSQAPVQPRHGHTSRDSIRYLLGSDAKKNQDFGMKLDIFTYNTFARTLDAWQMATFLFEILQPDLITFNSVMRLGS